MACQIASRGGPATLQHERVMHPEACGLPEERFDRAAIAARCGLRVRIRLPRET